MATKTVALNHTGYLVLDTTPGSAIDCQNVSTRHNARIVFAATEPVITETAFYRLKPGEGVSRDGKTGDMWAVSEQLYPAASDASVTVGE